VLLVFKQTRGANRNSSKATKMILYLIQRLVKVVSNQEESAVFGNLPIKMSNEGKTKISQANFRNEMPLFCYPTMRSIIVQQLTIVKTLLLLLLQAWPHSELNVSDFPRLEPLHIFVDFGSHDVEREQIGRSSLIHELSTHTRI